MRHRHCEGCQEPLAVLRQDEHEPHPFLAAPWTKDSRIWVPLGKFLGSAIHWQKEFGQLQDPKEDAVCGRCTRSTWLRYEPISPVSSTHCLSSLPRQLIAAKRLWSVRCALPMGKPIGNIFILTLFILCGALTPQLYPPALQFVLTPAPPGYFPSYYVNYCYYTWTKALSVYIIPTSDTYNRCPINTVLVKWNTKEIHYDITGGQIIIRNIHVEGWKEYKAVFGTV